MAQPNYPAAPAESSPLGRERVRQALIHLAQLAVAFEGGGMEFLERADGDAAASGEDDVAADCLQKVVETLERHMAAQRERQRNAETVGLHDALKALYAKLQADPEALDLDQAVGALLKERGFRADEDDFTEFVIEMGLLERGKSEAAAEALAGRMGVSPRTIYNWRARALARIACPLSWNRWVPRGLARRYVDEVFTSAMYEASETASVTLDDLKELRPSALRMLERKAEAECRAGTSEMFRFMFHGDLEGLPVPPKQAERDREALRELREYRALILERLRQLVRLEHDDAEHVDDDFEAKVRSRYEGLVEDAIRRTLQALGLA